MKLFNAHITAQVINYFMKIIPENPDYKSINEALFHESGIKDFFSENGEMDEMKEKLSIVLSSAGERDRSEYGDFQTTLPFAEQITKRLLAQGAHPDVIIEPTCGKGHFILACLSTFKSAGHITGIEIYKPYVWETKFNILDFFLRNPHRLKPVIDIIHHDIFTFNLKEPLSLNADGNVLIIGNPPWVTNAQLGSLSSKNIPKKSNFKKNSGLDAMTGKGNFDIAEAIIRSLLDACRDLNLNGRLALLIKNSVIKNIIFDQKKNAYRIGAMEKHGIDSKREFNVSVEASLFTCELNCEPGYDCREYNFYTGDSVLGFGWVKDKFVSRIADYLDNPSFDGLCPFEWRQGIKHDCADIMELQKISGVYKNKLNEIAEVEEDLLYGLLKSSDLKEPVISGVRKFLIVTQKKVGMDTGYIKDRHPGAYHYLNHYSRLFRGRKSGIYKGKPEFSIFGVGDYSFKPYKVAISGLYRTFHFSLASNWDGKPVMFDDTCYFIGFDRLEWAVYAMALLNSPQAGTFLRSITFPDAKRMFTKEILMRIDLLKLARNCPRGWIKEYLDGMAHAYGIRTDMKYWVDFMREMELKELRQGLLFSD